MAMSLWKYLGVGLIVGGILFANGWVILLGIGVFCMWLED